MTNVTPAHGRNSSFITNHALADSSRPRRRWRTVCGCNASEWDTHADVPLEAFIESQWSCKRCAAALRRTSRGETR